MSYLNYIDLFVLIIFIAFASVGFVRGFINEIISLFFIIIAGVVAILYTEPLANTFTSPSSLQEAVSSATSAIGIDSAAHASKSAIAFGFSTIFLGVVIIGMLAAFIIRAVLKMPPLNLGTRIIGAVFGLGKGLIISLVVVFILSLTTISAKDYWEDSEFIETFQPAINYLTKIVSAPLASEKTTASNKNNTAGNKTEQPTTDNKVS